MYIPAAASMQALGNIYSRAAIMLAILQQTYQTHLLYSQLPFTNGHMANIVMQVNPKRHNVPGMKERGRGRGRGPPRGRGFFPRGRGRGAFYGGFDPSYGYGGFGGGYG